MATRRIAIVISVEGGNKSSTAIRGVAKSSKELDRVVKQMDKGFNRLNSAMKRMEPQARKLSHLQSGLTNSFIKGNLAARGISFAIMNVQRAMVAGFASAVDFEFAMAKIAGITQPTAIELDGLSDKIRSVAAVSPRTAAEVANAALAMSKLGLSSKEAGDALEGVVGMSVALDEDVGRVGETLVNIKNVFNLEAKDLTRISNELFAGISKSALNLNKFSTSFAFAGGAARVAGVNFEQLTALMGTLADAGIKASTIGTQTRSVLIDLSDASSKASKLIGGETIQTIGLVEALKRVNEAELSAGEIKRIFGKRTVSVVAALTDNIDKIVELEDAQRKANGELEKAAELMNDTVIGAAKRVSSAWTDMWVAINQSQSGPLVASLKAIAGGIDVLTASIGRLSGKSPVAKIIEEHGGVEALMRGQAFEVPDAGNLPERAVRTQEDIEKANKLIAEQRKKRAKEALDDSLKQLKVQFDQLRTQEKLSTLLGEDTDTSKLMESYRGIADSLINIGANKEAITVLSEINRLTKIEEQPRLDILKRIREEDEAYEKSAEKSRKRAEQLKNEMMQWNNETSLYNTVVLGQFEVLGSSIDSFSNKMAESLIEMKFSAQDFGDMFKHLLANMVGQLTAVLIKMLVFRALLSAFGLASGGGFGFVGGSFLQQGILGAFGGQAKPYAKGYHGMIDSPTSVILGEEGPERVDITPRAKAARGGGSGGSSLVVNISGNVFNKEQFMDGVNEALEQLDRRTSRV